MGLAERVLGTAVAQNNQWVRDHADDAHAPNPRPLDGVAWHHRLQEAFPLIQAEWDSFVAAGHRLPRIEQVVDEHQGNEGSWRAGLLISRGEPCTSLASRFPVTVGALAGVPGLWSALWSVLEPGTELPEHEGPNAGMLRYHLGVRCGPDTALRVQARVTPYREREGILFDDTVPHAAWNRGPEPRTTLFLELLRPAPGLFGAVNRAVQRTLAFDPRYRRAPARATEWDLALNGRVGVPGDRATTATPH